MVVVKIWKKTKQAKKQSLELQKEISDLIMTLPDCNMEGRGGDGKDKIIIMFPSADMVTITGDVVVIFEATLFNTRIEYYPSIINKLRRNLRKVIGNFFPGADVDGTVSAPRIYR